MDFVIPSTKSPRRGLIEVYPKFIVKNNSKDLMIRGGDFYAIWDEDNHIWSTNQDTVIRLIDEQLDEYAKEIKLKNNDTAIKVLHMWDSDSGIIDKWNKYVQKQMKDNFHALDENIIFSNSEIKRTDYASKRLDYPLEEGDISSYEELISTLYSPEERQKIEWAIGAIVSGDSKKIQKFLVFYGSAGTGKSTIINIIQKLFKGYYSVFDAKALGSNSSFALEAFKSNPLVAIQHDGDLSKIEDNTRLNSIVSHELMTVNEKYKSTYANKFNSFLIMGTNKPVKITDAKSGIIRRLIDVTPTGNLIPEKRYNLLMSKIDFELGAIADHCLKVYNENKLAYSHYVPSNMIGATNDFYNFMEEYYDVFAKEDGITLKAAWMLYKDYSEEAKVPYPYSMRLVKEELKNYFRHFEIRKRMNNGEFARNYYYGFKKNKFEYKSIDENKEITIDFVECESILDKELKDCPAQYANDEEKPKNKWDKVKTKLSDIDTSKLHYVKVPENHIVIDFDIPDEKGNKSFEKNLDAAKLWPSTYAELSKSGCGIHLHYIYDGDTSKLSNIYDEHIEIKVFNGNSSLRRKLTKCNNIPIAKINSGLPLKGETKMVSFEAMKNEKSIRTLIKKNLNKEYHPGTKPSIDFINKILEESYASGISYDVTDMRPAVLAFASNSTNQSEYCIKLVNKMKFKSEETNKNKDSDDIIIFFDIEVFPNLLLVNWKKQGENHKVVRMINPSPVDVENLCKFKLIGFNNRRYDNHILYARIMGYSNEQLFNLSQRIINGSDNAFFSEAYNLSYADIYEFSSKKQGLKKFEIELGIHHQELKYDWDKPIPEDKWLEVAEYCDNDVIATEAVFNARKQDFIAREILADISGLTVNDTTRMHTTKIIFGNDKNPNLVYTDLSEMFPGYTFKDGKSEYLGEEPGEGGYVYAEPGFYGNVALLDIESMHPHSIKELNLFGNYTKNFTDIVDARLAIKHKDFSKAKKLFNGALSKYLQNEEEADKLSYALKIVINSVYGFTTAKFPNPFKDSKNIDNIVAKRGSLFMINLKR